MITLAWYLLKIMICSGILCAYYFLTLRNKAFHRWNRFYLLAAVLISLLAPMMKIHLFSYGEDKGSMVEMLKTISYGDEVVIEYTKGSGFELNTQNLGEGAYLLISLLLLSAFFISLYKIRRLRRIYPGTRMNGILFVATSARGTPFSFFKAIYWNTAIDLHSRSGQQVFNHEIAHVKEKHSYDKVFMNLVLVLFWINPFFWLIRKELNMIHEFIADEASLKDGDISSLAEMILQTVYPGQHFSLSSHFFYSPIKRRLLMLSKNKNPKVNYLSRLLALPLAATLFVAFTLKAGPVSTAIYDGAPLTVVIDAGHGGTDYGARSGHIEEKDLTLSLARLVRELNSNQKLHIVLTRDQDHLISVKDRVLLASEKKADLFISIHADYEQPSNLHQGLSVLIPGTNAPLLYQSKLLGSSLLESFRQNYGLPVSDNLKQKGNTPWVLRANLCPAVLIELGYLSSQKDLNYLSNPLSQQQIARNILSGIENYARQTTPDNKVEALVPPTIEKDSVLSVRYREKMTQEEGSKELITREEALSRKFNTNSSSQQPSSSGLNRNALYYINGKESTWKAATSIDPRRISAISVYKGEKAVSLYGPKGKEGVVLITVPDPDRFTAISDSVPLKMGTQGETTEKTTLPAKKGLSIDSSPSPSPLIFADGKEISSDEMKKIPSNEIISINIIKDENAVNKYGSRASNGVVEVTTSKSYSPTIQKDSVPHPEYSKVEQEASFPGGNKAWIDYITQKIEKSIRHFTKADYGTCVIRFIVDTDGKVSDVEATTMRGTHLAKAALNAIKNGPNWIPASQNGRAVRAYRLQPVQLQEPPNR